MYLIEPEDIKKNPALHGPPVEGMRVPETVILTFNRAIVEQLAVLCGLREAKWFHADHVPYCSASACWDGMVGDREVYVFIPPVGASPMAAFCEELISFGVRRIFLLCASWSVGDDILGQGQIHLPSFAIGPDGTSCHYGNVGYSVEAEPLMFAALADSLAESGADWKEGGVGCCEAIYRITPEMVDSYREQGCLSMENGEVAVLYTLAKVFGIQVGVLLQPYIDLTQGFDITYMGRKYHDTCRVQAFAAVDTIGKF